MKSSPRIFLFTTFFLFSFFLCASAQVSVPESQTIVVWGESAVSDDPSGDRQRALSQAKRNALEQVVGLYLTSRTRVRNFQVVEDRVYSKSAGFINSCTVLKEKRAKTQRVQVQAQVSVIPVTEILRNSGLLRQWRVGVVLSSDFQGSPTVLGYFSNQRSMEVIRYIETSIGQRLLEAGFKVVDPSHLETLRQETDPLGKITVSSSRGIDLLVGGSISLAARRSGGGLCQSVCQIHGKILRTDTGEIVYQGNLGNTFDGISLLVRRSLAEKYADTLGNGQLSDGTPDLRTYGSGFSAALDNAVRLTAAMTGDEILSQITRLPAAVSSIVVLEIQGLDFSRLMELEEEVRNFGGITSLTTEEYNGAVNSIEVEYDGDSMMLARAVSKSEVIRRMGLKVSRVTKSKIILKKQ